MCHYKCPFAERRKCAGFLLCRDMEEDGVNYNDRRAALGVICLHQKQCALTGLMENDEGAEKCYKARLTRKAAEVAARVIEEMTESPAEEPAAEEAPAPKKSRRKKTD